MAIGMAIAIVDDKLVEIGINLSVLDVWPTMENAVVGCGIVQTCLEDLASTSQSYLHHRP